MKSARVWLSSVEKQRMLRWILLLLYIPVAPLLLAKTCPDLKLSYWLAATALSSGSLVAAIHWRQPSWRAQLGILAGYFVSNLLGLGFWGVGLLLIAFASESSKNGSLALNLSIGYTLLIVLVAPVAGTLFANWIIKLRPQQKSP